MTQEHRQIFYRQVATVVTLFLALGGIVGTLALGTYPIAALLMGLSSVLIAFAAGSMKSDTGALMREIEVSEDSRYRVGSRVIVHTTTLGGRLHPFRNREGSVVQTLPSNGGDIVWVELDPLSDGPRYPRIAFHKTELEPR